MEPVALNLDSERGSEKWDRENGKEFEEQGLDDDGFVGKSR